MIGSTAEPTGGIPSLTTSEIVQLYQKYIGRPPDAIELASEQENAMKYSAAGIERQIANRASNVAGSGIRGDEGLPSLTTPALPPVVPATQVGNVVTMGPAGIDHGPSSSGPTGTLTGYYGAPYGPMTTYGQGATSAPRTSAAGGVFGMSWSTIALLAAVAGAAYYFLVVRK